MSFPTDKRRPASTDYIPLDVTKSMIEPKPPTSPVDQTQPFRNCADLPITKGEPTQVRKWRQLTDGSWLELTFGFQRREWYESWSTWLWRMARVALSGLLMRLVWMGVGVLAFTHPKVQQILASLPSAH